MPDPPDVGPRLAELLIAELSGRSFGPLAHISIPSLEHPTRFTCEVGDHYDLHLAGTSRGTLDVHHGHISIRLGERRIRIDDIRQIKPGVDEIGRWVSATVSD